ncbi:MULTISPECIES: hydrogenase [unclassified Nitratiruptor]|uniref:NADH-quinone oxidoreductase subunit B family protein n=1 Tax=unclassified Nitratiruptor TaxID=2624044 RepID=UPI0019164340|nr:MULTISPECIES: hydrogenase [unclassified Nitratiruptor]BCD64187.1 hydrogenase small subunit [Nitratiruptor sp. YY08-14]
MKAKIIWLQGVTCNGNSHSFLNLPSLASLLQQFEFLYHPLFPSPLQLMDLHTADFDILVVEGGLKQGWKKGDKDLYELFFHLAQKAKKIVAVGSCAVFGGVFKEFDPTITGVLFDKTKKSKLYEHFFNKTVNIPGCPAHPEWIAFAIENDSFSLDEYHRPKEIFAFTVHSGCTRNEYFEWKVDAKSFGTKEGCLFYEQGCQAPFTHGSCNRILWNEINSKTRSGTPCFGCTEPTFPKTGLFHTKTYMGIPANMPLGVPKRAYLTITGIAKSFQIPRLTRKLIDEN